MNAVRQERFTLRRLFVVHLQQTNWWQRCRHMMVAIWVNINVSHIIVRLQFVTKLCTLINELWFLPVVKIFSLTHYWRCHTVCIEPEHRSRCDCLSFKQKRYLHRHSIIRYWIQRAKSWLSLRKGQCNNNNSVICLNKLIMLNGNICFRVLPLSMYLK